MQPPGNFPNRSELHSLLDGIFHFNISGKVGLVEENLKSLLECVGLFKEDPNQLQQSLTQYFFAGQRTKGEISFDPIIAWMQVLEIINLRQDFITELEVEDLQQISQLKQAVVTNFNANITLLHDDAINSLIVYFKENNDELRHMTNTNLQSFIENYMAFFEVQHNPDEIPARFNEIIRNNTFYDYDANLDSFLIYYISLNAIVRKLFVQRSNMQDNLEAYLGLNVTDGAVMLLARSLGMLENKSVPVSKELAQRMLFSTLIIFLNSDSYDGAKLTEFLNHANFKAVIRVAKIEYLISIMRVVFRTNPTREIKHIIFDLLETIDNISAGDIFKVLKYIQTSNNSTDFDLLLIKCMEILRSKNKQLTIYDIEDLISNEINSTILDYSNKSCALMAIEYYIGCRANLGTNEAIALIRSIHIQNASTVPTLQKIFEKLSPMKASEVLSNYAFDGSDSELNLLEFALGYYESKVSQSVNDLSVTQLSNWIVFWFKVLERCSLNVDNNDETVRHAHASAMQNLNMIHDVIQKNFDERGVWKYLLEPEHGSSLSRNNLRLDTLYQLIKEYLSMDTDTRKQYPLFDEANLLTNLSKLDKRKLGDILLRAIKHNEQDQVVTKLKENANCKKIFGEISKETIVALTDKIAVLQLPISAENMQYLDDLCLQTFLYFEPISPELDEVLSNIFFEKPYNTPLIDKWVSMLGKNLASLKELKRSGESYDHIVYMYDRILTHILANLCQRLDELPEPLNGKILFTFCDFNAAYLDVLIKNAPLGLSGTVIDVLFYINSKKKLNATTLQAFIERVITQKYNLPEAQRQLLLVLVINTLTNVTKLINLSQSETDYQGQLKSNKEYLEAIISDNHIVKVNFIKCLVENVGRLSETVAADMRTAVLNLHYLLNNSTGAVQDKLLRLIDEPRILNYINSEISLETIINLYSECNDPKIVSYLQKVIQLYFPVSVPKYIQLIHASLTSANQNLYQTLLQNIPADMLINDYVKIINEVDDTKPDYVFLIKLLDKVLSKEDSIQLPVTELETINRVVLDAVKQKCDGAGEIFIKYLDKLPSQECKILFMLQADFNPKILDDVIKYIDTLLNSSETPVSDNIKALCVLLYVTILDVFESTNNDNEFSDDYKRATADLMLDNIKKLTPFDMNVFDIVFQNFPKIYSMNSSSLPLLLKFCTMLTDSDFAAKYEILNPGSILLSSIDFFSLAASEDEETTKTRHNIREACIHLCFINLLDEFNGRNFYKFLDLIKPSSFELRKLINASCLMKSIYAEDSLDFELLGGLCLYMPAILQMTATEIDTILQFFKDQDGDLFHRNALCKVLNLDPDINSLKDAVFETTDLKDNMFENHVKKLICFQKLCEAYPELDANNLQSAGRSRLEIMSACANIYRYLATTYAPDLDLQHLFDSEVFRGENFGSDSDISTARYNRVAQRFVEIIGAKCPSGFGSIRREFFDETGRLKAEYKDQHGNLKAEYYEGNVDDCLSKLRAMVLEQIEIYCRSDVPKSAQAAEKCAAILTFISENKAEPHSNWNRLIRGDLRDHALELFSLNEGAMPAWRFITQFEDNLHAYRVTSGELVSFMKTSVMGVDQSFQAKHDCMELNLALLRLLFLAMQDVLDNPKLNEFKHLDTIEKRIAHVESWKASLVFRFEQATRSYHADNNPDAADDHSCPHGVVGWLLDAFSYHPVIGFNKYAFITQKTSAVFKKILENELRSIIQSEMSFKEKQEKMRKVYNAMTLYASDIPERIILSDQPQQVLLERVQVADLTELNSFRQEISQRYPEVNSLEADILRELKEHKEDLELSEADRYYINLSKTIMFHDAVHLSDAKETFDAVQNDPAFLLERDVIFATDPKTPLAIGRSKLNSGLRNYLVRIFAKSQIPADVRELEIDNFVKEILEQYTKDRTALSFKKIIMEAQETVQRLSHSAGPVSKADFKKA
jgi:hypothetical protein